MVDGNKYYSQPSQWLMGLCANTGGTSGAEKKKDNPDYLLDIFYCFEEKKKGKDWYDGEKITWHGCSVRKGLISYKRRRGWLFASFTTPEKPVFLYRGEFFTTQLKNVLFCTAYSQGKKKSHITLSASTWHVISYSYTLIYSIDTIVDDMTTSTSTSFLESVTN